MVKVRPGSSEWRDLLDSKLKDAGGALLWMELQEALLADLAPRKAAREKLALEILAPGRQWQSANGLRPISRRST